MYVINQRTNIVITICSLLTFTRELSKYTQSKIGSSTHAYILVSKLPFIPAEDDIHFDCFVFVSLFGKLLLFVKVARL